MLILDTNILSAMMSTQLPPELLAWLGDQPEELLFTTVISEAEIRSGLAIMPDGRRRRDLEAAATAMFVEDFDGRVLSFDLETVGAYVEIFAARRRAGRPIATLDLMIAAIARSHGASVVTRDAGGFAGCGIEVIDPWRRSGS